MKRPLEQSKHRGKAFRGSFLILLLKLLLFASRSSEQRKYFTEELKGGTKHRIHNTTLESFRREREHDVRGKRLLQSYFLG